MLLQRLDQGRIEIRDDHAVLFPEDRFRHISQSSSIKGRESAPCTRLQAFGRLVPGMQDRLRLQILADQKQPAISMTGPMSLSTTPRKQRRAHGGKKMQDQAAA